MIGGVCMGMTLSLLLQLSVLHLLVAKPMRMSPTNEVMYGWQRF